MGESWELLEEVHLCKEGRKMCGRKKKEKISGNVLKTEKRPREGKK